jgi:hypothetical protein
MPPEDQLSSLCERALTFSKALGQRRKMLAPSEFWYPYATINNFRIINQLLTGPTRNLLFEIEPKRAADIGGADGDISFFLEQEGWHMTLIDNPPTNWNHLRGAKLIKQATGSSIGIIELDLDFQFALAEDYDLIFFLGILYHLKNPFYVLEQLGKSARYALLSTRVMRWSGPPKSTDAGATQQHRQLVEHLPLAYLLGPAECNNDATNYWIFSEAGLRRLIERTGWRMENYLLVGNVEDADPFTLVNDARAFCLLKSQRFAAKL